jgi:hypothetical protein
VSFVSDHWKPDRREVGLLDLLRDILRRRLRAELAAQRLRLVLVEAVELRDAPLLERSLHDFERLRTHLRVVLLHASRAAGKCGNRDGGSDDPFRLHVGSAFSA